MIINGVHFSEYNTENLKCFAAYPDTVKIYLFINGDDVDTVLNVAADEMQTMLSKCVTIPTSANNRGETESVTDDGYEYVPSMYVKQSTAS